MSINFNPAEVASAKTDFNIAPEQITDAGLAFLVRRSARRERRNSRTF